MIRRISTTTDTTFLFLGRNIGNFYDHERMNETISSNLQNLSDVR